VTRPTTTSAKCKPVLRPPLEITRLIGHKPHNSLSINLIWRWPLTDNRLSWQDFSGVGLIFRRVRDAGRVYYFGRGRYSGGNWVAGSDLAASDALWLCASFLAFLASFFCTRRSAFMRCFSSLFISFWRFKNVVAIDPLLEISRRQ